MNHCKKCTTGEACEVCETNYGLNATDNKCIECTASNNYIEEHVCKTCKEHADYDRDEKDCICTEAYFNNTKGECERNTTVTVCIDKDGEEFTLVPGECYPEYDKNDAFEVAYKYLHEEGTYKVCNYTDEKCEKQDNTTGCYDYKVVAAESEDLANTTCSGGACTGGYSGPNCEDSGVMNMIVIALICVAIML